MSRRRQEEWVDSARLNDPRGPALPPPLCIFCGERVVDGEPPCSDGFDHMLTYLLESELGDDERTY